MAWNDVEKLFLIAGCSGRGIRLPDLVLVCICIVANASDN